MRARELLEGNAGGWTRRVCRWIVEEDEKNALEGRRGLYLDYQIQFIFLFLRFVQCLPVM